MGECVFQGIGPFHLGHPICGQRVVHNISLSSFYCPWDPQWCLLFHLWQQWFVSSLFFLVNLVRSLSVLLYFQRTWFWFYSLSLNFIDFCSNAYYFFLLLTVDLISSSFSGFLNINLGYWFYISSFLICAFNVLIFPSVIHCFPHIFNTLCFNSYLVQNTFYFSCHFFLWPMCYWEVCCLICMYFGFFSRYLSITDFWFNCVVV